MTKRMVPHVVITRAEVDNIIVRRTGAHHPSLRVVASLARPFEGLDFQPDFVN
jgi:hypothetical protein